MIGGSIVLFSILMFITIKNIIKEGIVYFQSFTKIVSVLLVLSLAFSSSFAQSQIEENATYIYLPKIPPVDAVTPIAKKALKVPPVITVVPKSETEIKTKKN